MNISRVVTDHISKNLQAAKFFVGASPRLVQLLNVLHELQQLSRTESQSPVAGQSMSVVQLALLPPLQVVCGFRLNFKQTGASFRKSFSGKSLENNITQLTFHTRMVTNRPAAVTSPITDAVSKPSRNDFHS
jgi:hypothetical protein